MTSSTDKFNYMERVGRLAKPLFDQLVSCNTSAGTGTVT